MYEIIMVDTNGNAEHTATIGHKSNLLDTMLDFMHHHHEFESVVIRRYRPDTEEDETMATDTTYNGWTNHATWLVNLYWGDYIRGIDVEIENTGHLEEIVYTNCQGSVDSSFVMDMFMGYMDQVNWQEILDSLEG